VIEGRPVNIASVACRIPVQVVACLWLFATVADAAEIRVMISGGFSAAYAELLREFERTTRHTLVTSRGASMGTTPDSIPSRLQRGEPVDVFIMVGDALEELNKQGKVATGSRVDLAHSRIGLAVRAGAPKPDIRTVDGFKRAMLEAKSIAISTSASGTFLSNELFPRLGIADEMRNKTRSVSGEAAGAPVARGEAEIALQQISELLPVKGIDYVGALPSEIQKVTVFSAAIAAGAKEPEAARALLQFLASPAAAPAIAKSALEPLAR